MKATRTKRYTEVLEYIAQRLFHLRTKIIKIPRREAVLSLEITSQQLQKYEYGESRINAETLFVYAQAYHIPIQYFFPPQDGIFLTDEVIDYAVNIAALNKEQQEAFLAIVDLMEEERI